MWPGAVLRGDYGTIVVGERTSIQDGTVIHATHELATIIGPRCVIGHIVHLEGCTIEPARWSAPARSSCTGASSGRTRWSAPTPSCPTG